MAKGDDSTLKNTRSWRESRGAVPDDESVKVVQSTVDKRPETPTPSQPAGRIQRASNRQKVRPSQLVNDGTRDVSDDKNPNHPPLAKDSLESSSIPLASTSRMNSIPGGFPEIDDTDVSGPHDAQDEVPGTEKAPITYVHSHRSVHMADKPPVPISLAEVPINVLDTSNNERTKSVPEMTDTGSAPTQVPIMSNGSATLFVHSQRTSFDTQREPSNLSKAGVRSMEVIADLVQLHKPNEAVNYITARDMSFYLDEMAGPVLSSYRRSLPGSLTPFLVAPASYIHFLAETASSVEEHTDLFRMYVSAWIFMALTESRMEGLVFNIIARLTIRIPPETQRDAFVLKSGELARLARQTWLSDLSVRRIYTSATIAPVSSGRARISLQQSRGGVQSSLAPTVLSLPRQKREGRVSPITAVNQPELEAVEFPRPANRKELLKHTETQYRDHNRPAKPYLDIAPTQLANGFLGLGLSWIEMMRGWMMSTGEHLRSLPEEKAPDFFVPGRIFDMIWPKSSPSQLSNARSAFSNILAGSRSDVICSDIRRFVVVQGGPGHCYALPVYTLDRSDSKSHRGSKKQRRRHPIIFDSKKSHKRTAKRRRYIKKSIPVKMEAGEMLRDRSRLNIDELEEIDWHAKVKGVGSITGSRDLRTLQSFFKIEDVQRKVGKHSTTNKPEDRVEGGSDAEQIPDTMDSQDDCDSSSDWEVLAPDKYPLDGNTGNRVPSSNEPQQHNLAAIFGQAKDYMHNYVMRWIPH